MAASTARSAAPRPRSAGSATGRCSRRPGRGGRPARWRARLPKRSQRCGSSLPTTTGRMGTPGSTVCTNGSCTSIECSRRAAAGPGRTRGRRPAARPPPARPPARRRAACGSRCRGRRRCPGSAPTVWLVPEQDDEVVGAAPRPGARRRRRSARSRRSPACGTTSASGRGRRAAAAPASSRRRTPRRQPPRLGGVEGARRRRAGAPAVPHRGQLHTRRDRARRALRRSVALAQARCAVTNSPSRSIDRRPAPRAVGVVARVAGHVADVGVAQALRQRDLARALERGHRRRRQVAQLVVGVEAREVHRHVGPELAGDPRRTAPSASASRVVQRGHHQVDDLEVHAALAPPA